MLSSALYLLSSFLLTVHAAPSCLDADCQRSLFDRRQVQWEKRTAIILSETQDVTLLKTSTSTHTETSTSTAKSASTLSPSSISSHFPSSSVAATGVTSVLFLPPSSIASSHISSSSASVAKPTLLSSASVAKSTFTSSAAVVSPSPSLSSILFSPPSRSPLAPVAPLSSTPPQVVPTPVSTIAKASATSVSVPKPTTTTVPLAGPIVAAYYPDWAVDTLSPEQIDFTRFDWVDYAFAIPDQNFNLTWDDPANSPSILNRLVTAGHAKGKKVKLSIGGWDGSMYFSPAVSNETSRQTFVTNIASLYTEYDLDGIDIDWEYPGLAGDGNNQFSSDDSANFLVFLEKLRSTLPTPARISAAVQVTPFADANGQPMTDVSAYADVLDWVMIMNYDIFGSSATPGPNAPLSDACHNSTLPAGSATAAVQAWTAAKFPASKLVLGVPAYGYINTSNKTSLVTRSNSRHFQRAAATQQVKLKGEDGTTNGGQIQFNQLVAQGALVSSASAGNASYVGGGGFSRSFDACSSSPFLTSPNVAQVITYDDPESLGLKAAFAKTAGILGVEMFDLTGDTATWDLTDSVRKGLGINS